MRQSVRSHVRTANRQLLREAQHESLPILGDLGQAITGVPTDHRGAHRVHVAGQTFTSTVSAA